MSELESTFIEEINPKNRKIIIESIYKHPTMDLNDFKNIFLNKLINPLRGNISKLPTNCFSVFDHFVGLALKGLRRFQGTFPCIH